MTVENHSVIDVVAHDATTDTVVLAMVEHREWGDKGQLLPDLQEKLNTYLAFAVDGQLAEQYPDLKGKRLRFRLFSPQPLGAREKEFVRIVCKQHLAPRGIEWQESLLSEDDNT